MAGTSWIVCIGVGSNKVYPQLVCPSADATAVFQRIASDWECPREQSVLILEEDATSKICNTALIRALTESRLNDKVFIFLSGHMNPNVQEVTASFVTYDYDPTRPSSGINLRRLRHLVEDSVAKEVIVFLDGCHAGVIGQGLSADTPHRIQFTTGEMDSSVATKLFLAAVSSGCKAYESQGSLLSQATACFVCALAECDSRTQSISVYELLERLASDHKTGKLVAEPVVSGVIVGSPTLYRGLGSSLARIPSMPSWLFDLEGQKKQDLTDKSVFIADLNFPDGSSVLKGSRIRKGWRIKNAGSQVWKNRFLSYVGSKGTGTVNAPVLTILPDLAPGQEGDVWVDMQLPDYPGSIYAEFKMVDRGGDYLFPNLRGLYIKLEIVEAEF